MIENWSSLEKGLYQMANFLESQGIYDKQRLPTNAVLGVIAALYHYIPDSGDARGSAEIILKQYMWRSFFTDRYENSTASRAYYDYKILKAIFTKSLKEDGSLYSLEEAPVFSSDYQLATIEELKTVKWPKGENVKGRAILAITTLLGAFDFADGQKATRRKSTRSTTSPLSHRSVRGEESQAPCTAENHTLSPPCLLDSVLGRTQNLRSSKSRPPILRSARCSAALGLGG